jgi:mannosyltransferase
MAIGTALRLYHLEARGLNIDEAASWTFARLPWPNFLHVMWEYEGNMVFYYILLRGWIALGDSEAILRGLSVILGLATIPAVYFLGKCLFNRQAGLISAALLAVHSLHIRYSQEARSYILLTFLLVLSTYCLVKAVDEPYKKKYLIAYTVLSALAFYSQVFAAFVLVAQWLSLGFAKIRRIGFSASAITVAALVLLTAPMTVFTVLQNKGQLDWVQPITWKSFRYFMYHFTGNGGNIMSFVYLAPCIFALFILSKTANNEHWRLRLVAVWLIFPIAATLLASFIKLPFYPRFFLMCVPALVLLASAGITWLGHIHSYSRWASLVLCIFLLVLSVRGSYASWQSVPDSKNSFRAMTEHILVSQEPNDGLFFFTAESHMPFNYYAHRASNKHGKTITPKIVFPDFGGTPTGAHPIPTSNEVVELTEDYERIWLVLNQPSITLIPKSGEAEQMIREIIEENFQLQEWQEFKGFPDLVVALYVQKKSKNLE